MIPFFQKLPKVLYNNVLLTDISIRIKYSEFHWMKDPTLYYDYIYQDHDTPDNIAARYYDNSSLHWIILLTNGILNPNFDLPLKNLAFIDYLNEKYKTEGEEVNLTGTRYAQITPDPVYGYQKIITLFNLSTNTLISEDYYLLDEYNYKRLRQFDKTFTDNYDTILYSQKKGSIVTIFARENEINENKRNIKILKKEYKGEAIKSLTSLINSIQTI